MKLSRDRSSRIRFSVAFYASLASPASTFSISSGLTDDTQISGWSKMLRRYSAHTFATG